MTKIADLNFKGRTDGLPGTMARVAFENEYVASIITGPYVYSAPGHPYEIAVIYDNRIVYDTPVTDDVCGRLSEDEANDILAQIEALPAR